MKQLRSVKVVHLCQSKQPFAYVVVSPRALIVGDGYVDAASPVHLGAKLVRHLGVDLEDVLGDDQGAVGGH